MQSTPSAWVRVWDIPELVSQITSHLPKSAIIALMHTNNHIYDCIPPFFQWSGGVHSGALQEILVERVALDVFLVDLYYRTRQIITLTDASERPWGYTRMERLTISVGVSHPQDLAAEVAEFFADEDDVTDSFKWLQKKRERHGRHTLSLIAQNPSVIS
ncbi:hypothetical protein BGX29_007247 [Mortierella sp. GBA35]|nr:hypothetical protein BGX29_007247 [Mortierella sp. GBA35]